MIIMSRKLAEVLAAKRESKQIEFKESFDAGEPQDWCEVLKDLVAIANSGGGYILFAVKNDGSPSGWDRSQLCTVDPAKIADKILSYTGEHFAEFELLEVERDGKTAALMTIQSVHTPLVFSQPGTYLIGGANKRPPSVEARFTSGTGQKANRALHRILGNLFGEKLRAFAGRGLATSEKLWPPPEVTR
jgi:predicted HTH transcriptional regulator